MLSCYLFISELKQCQRLRIYNGTLLRVSLSSAWRNRGPPEVVVNVAIEMRSADKWYCAGISIELE